MKNLKLFCKWLTAACVLFLSTFPIHGQKRQNAEVFVLSTLHQFHDRTKFYSFEKLSQIVEKFDPDVIAVELTADAAQAKSEQKTKQEYQKSIFPLAEKHRYKMVALEPEEPKFSELVNLVTSANRELREKSPDKAEAFSIFSENLYEYLFKKWDSPLSVNSSETDALFEVKHEFQKALFGEKEEKGWEGWNTCFLDKIIETAKQNPGKKIIVTVGVEHAYWLRDRLRQHKGVNFIEAAEILK